MILTIPSAAWIVVCDGQKALFLRNDGDAVFPALRMDHVTLAPRNKRSAEQGTDRPGRLRNYEGPISAVAETDWHAQFAIHFAERIAREIEELQDDGRPHPIILVAPPKMLATLRAHLNDATRAHIISEIGKDLTKHPIDEIEKLLIEH
ncbi:host attachment protein [Methylovirgula sp. 4M-Z18]|uniref:host attachment protein n=1 Tax=Methylovirgula sp. 4M-Z18 TaxID=2293567 RepID=UPI001314EF7C|nr:host attachment protein [Methylovirgula sp. 4M-Z18]